MRYALNLDAFPEAYRAVISTDFSGDSRFAIKAKVGVLSSAVRAISM